MNNPDLNKDFQKTGNSIAIILKIFKCIISRSIKNNNKKSSIRKIHLLKEKQWSNSFIKIMMPIALFLIICYRFSAVTAHDTTRKHQNSMHSNLELTITPSPTPDLEATVTPTFTEIPKSELTPDTYFSSYRYNSWDIPEEVSCGNLFWIEINLSKQTLYAYRSNQIINAFLVSTGTSRYATVTGIYKIYAKYPACTMTGPNYHLTDVPYSMFFHKGYAIHGTYWHSNFGTPMSHGCVNMRTEEAAWIYQNAPVGTYVFVHY